MEQQNKKEITTVVSEGKNIAIISYLTLIGLIMAFVMNNDSKNSFAAYHIRQSLGLMLTGLVLGVIAMIPILGWIVYIVGVFVLLYMWVMGLLKALNEKQEPVPFLGDNYEEWFKNI